MADRKSSDTDEGYEQVPPPSSIPSTQANTPKMMSSTRKRSVPGTLIRSVSDSFKSHLKVLSGSHRHHQSHVEEDNGQNFHDHNKQSFRAIPEHSLSNHSSTSTIKAGGLHDNINTSWRDTHSNAPKPDRSNLISSAQKIIQQQEIQEQIEMQEQQQSSDAADAAMMDGFVPIAAVSRRQTPTYTSSQASILASSHEKHQKFYMGSSSTATTTTKGPSAVKLINSWSWSEQFFSQDDESVSVSNASGGRRSTDDDVDAVEKSLSFPSVGGGATTNNNAKQFDSILEEGSTSSGGDKTCNDTIFENVRQRSKKATRASNVAAFVTFLKALFGIGMLSNPAVLGEVGLVLGTFCHLFIVVGCAFSCYLLLAARQIAKNEVLARERRDDELRENYELWRLDMENRAAARAGRGENTNTNNDSCPPKVQQRQQHEQSKDDNNEFSPVGSNTTEEWTVAPVPLATIPLERVRTSQIPPKEGWGRCEDAIKTLSAKDCNYNSNIVAATTHKLHAATPSCGNIQMIRQPSTKNSSRSSKSSPPVSDEYQRFTDNIHRNYMPPPPAMPPTPPPPKQAPVRLVTYGDVAKYLAGRRASVFIIFTIVTVHLMFASGMVHLAVENLCYVIGWERLGWSYVEEYYEEEDGDGYRMRRLGSKSRDEHASRSSDEEGYYLEWKGPDFVGRLAMASLLFPIIHGLLQIPSLTELATISTVGLVTYAVGCVGSMLYTALVLTDGHPFQDHPTDMWTSKWSGIPTYVATTIYCIEGINLALPTVSSIEGTQRWTGFKRSQNQNNGSFSNERDLSVFIVVGAVFLYGVVTLVVSWIGLAGGLGGGIGTIHGEDGCWDVTYCLNSSAVRFVYMLSLGIALVLTLPVILYPSTEMLEVWLDERKDERRRKMEAAAMMSEPQVPSKREPFWLHQKSLLPGDDETVYTVSDTLSPRPMGIVNKQDDIEMKDMSCSNGAGEYVAPSFSPEPSPMTSGDNVSLMSSPTSSGPETSKVKAKRNLKYWKLRMFLALVICIVGTIEGSFPTVLKAAEVIRGVGLSIAGLIFPPLLYMSALGGNFSVPMAAAMALLIGLGFFNIVLVLMSAFGSRDYIVEEGRNNVFYEL